MIADQARFDRAIARFDALNDEDPNRESADGKTYAKETLYAGRMSTMLARYAPDASEALQLAARCQHIQRWKIPRSSYPMTKPGYYQWRNALKEMHAATAERVLREAGYDQHSIDRVCALLRKEALKTDSEAQMLEDVIVLVFLGHYLENFVELHSDYDTAKFMDILRKSLRKMSAQGRQAARSLIVPPPALAPLIRQLLDECAETP